jgi:hypothetical protein
MSSRRTVDDYGTFDHLGNDPIPREATHRRAYLPRAQG